MQADSISSPRSVVFYDGECGLCQGFVRFLLWRDAAGKHFMFSPLEGHHIRELLTEADRAALPDSLVLRTPDGNVRTRSESVLSSFDQLGGFWRFVALAGRIVPLGIRDAVYDCVARTRRRLFGGTPYHCPLVPARLRDRFLD
jgi:predicted DCC family thiol-disulfide oxidoreductase YuxK